MGDQIRIKQLCREAVDSSGVSNGVDSVDRDSSRRVNSETDKDRFVLFLVLYLLFLVCSKNSSLRCPVSKSRVFHS